MIPFIIYLLKVSVSMLLLFVTYYLLFRKNTFHQTNRICLLFVIVFSFVVPLISVTGPRNPAESIISIIRAPYSEWKETEPEIKRLTSNSTDPVSPIVMWIYLIGVLFFSCRFIKSIFSLYKLGTEATPEIKGKFRIRRTCFKKSFTFLNIIFLPKGETDPIVLQHEQAHVAQCHWIDLLVVEIAFIILWFNPILKIVRNELRLQHEFLADRAVMRMGISFEDYAQCLIRNMTAEKIIGNPTSPISSSSNKKRIAMMTKEQTPMLKFILYIFFIPASIVLLMSFGKKPNALQAPVRQEATIARGENIPDVAPVDFSRVVKVVLYGKRINPAPGQMQHHLGIDFELAEGSDVFATAGGVVEFVRYGDKYGNYVRIRHGDTYSTQYSHLTRATVEQGDKITKGQVIGLVGNTGLSKIPHLHYEVLKNGTMVDPKNYLPKLPDSQVN